MKKDDWNKYLSNFMSMDEKKLYGVFAGILLLVFLLDYFVIMRPQLNALSTIGADIEVNKQEIEKTRKNVKNLDLYQSQVEQNTALLKEMKSLVKSKDEISLILERISNMADQNGVRLDQLKPEAYEQELILENNQFAYYSFPIIVEGRTRYHDFGRFINAIENANICLTITDLSISSVDRSDYHSMALSLNAIVYEEKHVEEE